MKKQLSDDSLFTHQEIIGSYLDGVKEAVDFVGRKIIPVLKSQFNLKRNEKAIIGTFFRIHFLASSLTRLNLKIDFNAVAIICRTIFELLLDIKLLSSSNLTEKDLDRFYEFSGVDRYRKAKRLVDFQKEHPQLVDATFIDSKFRDDFINIPGKKDDVETKVASLWGHTKKEKLKWPNHWTGISIREQAENLGDPYVLKYLEVYSFMSSYTHSGSSAYAGLSEEALESVYGNSLELSRKMYIQSLLICSKAFNLQAGIESFEPIISFLRNAPNEIMIEYGLKKIEKDKNA